MDVPADRHLVLPPLAAPPHWAVGRPPDREIIQELWQEAATVRELVRTVATALIAIPGPLPEHLAQLDITPIPDSLNTIIGTLRALPYPADLTAWINDARVLAVRSATRFDDLVGRLQRICLPSFDIDDYCDGMSELRRCVADLLRDLEALLTHFDAYLDSKAARHATVRDISWRLGRQAGLKEAFQVCKSAIHSLPAPLLTSQAQAIETAIAQQLEQLRLSPGTRNVFPAPLKRVAGDD